MVPRSPRKRRLLRFNWNERSLAFRQSVLVLGIVIVLFGCVAWLFSVWLCGAMFANMREEVQVSSQRIAGELDLSFLRISRSVDVLATLVPHLHADCVDELKYTLEYAIQALHRENAPVYGGSFSLLPEYRERYGFGMWYAQMLPDDTVSGREVLSDELEYWKQPWFTTVMESRKSSWSEPYFDPVGQVLMTTYSAPIFDVNPDNHGAMLQNEAPLIGVMTIDVSLKWLNDELVKGVQREEDQDDGFFSDELSATEFTGDFAQNCYAFLAAPDGCLLVHPDESLVLHNIHEERREVPHDVEYRQVLQRMLDGETNFEPIPFSRIFQDKAYIFYMPLNTADWRLGLMVNHRMLYRGLVFRMASVVLVVFAGALVASWLVMRVTFRGLKPIGALSRCARKIGDGNFHEPLPEVKGGNELAQLSGALGDMQNRLQSYFSEIEIAATARARLDSELKLAQAIQNSLLPACAYWEIPGVVEAYGFLSAARQVGGDLYDFYLSRDEKKLYFVIGDVSGKEISGALVMAVAQTLQRGYAAGGTLRPGEILTRVNADLCRNNESMMFVTLFMGCLDLESGAVVFSNAGHNPPYLIADNGIRERLNTLHGPPLGVMSDYVYSENSVSLRNGEWLCCYTDGVTEAENLHHEQFGVSRLEQLLNHRGGDIRKRLERVAEAVEKFRGGAEASDDTTLLLIHFQGVRDRVQSDKIGHSGGI